MDDLKRLLHSISQSTVLPNQVSVSISTSSGELHFEEYPFEFLISQSPHLKNPCDNRNIAAKRLSTDIISFIDADDISHIKRNEYLLEAFKLGSKAVQHNFLWHPDYNQNFHISDVGDFEYYPHHSGEFPGHSAHTSILKEIFDVHQYDESIGWICGEDTEYNLRLLSNGIGFSYIKNKLSQYVQEL
jgi:phage pi2 protein 07